jgi:DNA-binding response OmpR family regulator
MVRGSHNPQLYRILAVGSDVSRLSSRANVLTQAGYTVDLVLDCEHAARRVRAGEYHLAVISSTFSPDEQVAIRTRLSKVRESLPILLLGPEHDSPDVLLTDLARSLKQKTKFVFGTRLDSIPLDHGAK